MLESIIDFLETVPWEWVVITAFSLPYIENLFPPAPCDTALVFIGTLVGIETVGFFQMITLATLGSTFGFMTAYWIGAKFGELIIDSPKFKFINRKRLRKPEELFRKHGDWIIVINRFMSGTRGVISFFAGISKLKPIKTFILAAISALIWNSFLIGLGFILGKNWRLVQQYLSIYGTIVWIIVVGLVLYLGIRWYIKNFKGIKES